MDLLGLCLILTAKLVPITALISLPNTFPISLFIIFIRHFFIHISFLANNTLLTDMAGYATKPSLAFCPLLEEWPPLKPLIFYFPQGKSPWIGTYHLEIPHGKLISPPYFPINKMHKNWFKIRYSLSPPGNSPWI